MRLRLFIFACLSSALTCMYAEDQPLSSEQKAVLPSYLKDLEELGYCVIPNVISREETEVLYQRVWHEYIEKAWPNCKMDDRTNWKEEFPSHNKMAIFAGPAGQTQVMWDVRQDPRIVDIFAQIWNTSDLVVSMDGMSLMCPSEIREEHVEPWPHVDQEINRRQDGAMHNNCLAADCPHPAWRIAARPRLKREKLVGYKMQPTEIGSPRKSLGALCTHVHPSRNSRI